MYAHGTSTVYLGFQQVGRKQADDAACNAVLLMYASNGPHLGRKENPMQLDAKVTDNQGATPTATPSEWARKPESLVLPDEALAMMLELVEAAPQPSPRLWAAARRLAK